MQEDFLVRVWDEIMISRENTRRNLPPRGVDGVGPHAFEAKKRVYCAEISRVLRRAAPDASAPTVYRFAPLIERELEAEPGKLRRIYIPRIRDQIVLRCLYQNLTTAMRKQGLRGSLINPQVVVRRVIRSRLNGRRYAARLDIRGFYDAVSHDVLFDLLQSLPIDPATAHLLKQLVAETPHRPFRGTRSDNQIRFCGLPTGTSVATLLAEFYLSAVDQVASELDGIDYLRFVDDIIVLGTDEATLKRSAMRLAEAAAVLRLELHGNKSHFSSFDRGFDFLGFRFQGDALEVAPDRIHKLKRRFEALYRSCLREHSTLPPAEQLEAVTRAFNVEISGTGSRHIGYYALADDLEVYREVDGYLSRMLGGLARRSGTSLQLESCHAWAWRYKKDAYAAAARGRRLFLS